LVTSDYSSKLYVFLGNGDGTFKSPTSISSPERPRALVLVDLNGDGNLDLAVGHRSGSGVGILLGNGNGTFAAETTNAVASGPTDNDSLKIADMNGDGRPDIVVTADTGEVSVLVNGASGSFAGPATTIDQTAPTASIAVGPAPVSIDSTALIA